VLIDPILCQSLIQTKQAPNNDTLYPLAWNLYGTKRIPGASYYWCTTHTMRATNYFFIRTRLTINPQGHISATDTHLLYPTPYTQGFARTTRGILLWDENVHFLKSTIDCTTKTYKPSVCMLNQNTLLCPLDHIGIFQIGTNVTCGRLLGYVRLTSTNSYTIKFYRSLFGNDQVNYAGRFVDIFDSVDVRLDTILSNQLGVCELPQSF